MSFVLGLAGGGSRSRALLVDEKLSLLASTTGGALNIQVRGAESVKKEFKALLGALRGPADQEPGGALASVAGLAGAGLAEDAVKLESLLREAGAGGAVRVLPDARVDLEGGTAGLPGCLLIAGTGSMAFGRNAAGEFARAGGQGPYVSDEGSAFALALAGLREVFRAEDGRRSPGLLKGFFLKRLDFDRVDDLRRWFLAHLQDKTAVAALAPALFEAANLGDEAAREVLEKGLEDLAELGWTVLRRLGLEKESFPLVLSGGVLERQPAFAARLAERLRSLVPGLQAGPAREEGALGAARLAWALTRGELRWP